MEINIENFFPNLSSLFYSFLALSISFVLEVRQRDFGVCSMMANRRLDKFQIKLSTILVANVWVFSIWCSMLSRHRMSETRANGDQTLRLGGGGMGGGGLSPPQPARIPHKPEKFPPPNRKRKKVKGKKFANSLRNHRK